MTHSTWILGFLVGLTSCNGLTSEYCGSGTHSVDGVCQPSVNPIVCGRGTHQSDGACVPNSMDAGDSCGAGSHDVGGSCVPNLPPNSYAIRVPVPEVPADGITKIPVVAFGTAPDGSPSTAEVIIGMSRPIGSLSPTQLGLLPTGSASLLTPCAQSDSNCLGLFTLTLALAAAPNSVVATSEPIRMASPTGVGSPAACLGGGNVVFFDSALVAFGQRTVQLGTWRLCDWPKTDLSSVCIEVAPEASDWKLSFSSAQLQLPLTEQVYSNAERTGFENAGHAGLEVSGNGFGYNSISGRFQIERLVWSGAVLQSFTATFEENSEVRGCVHFEQ